VTAGNLISFFTFWNTSTVTLNSVADNCATGGGSDTYSLLDNPTAGTGLGRSAQGYAVIGHTGPCTVTFTFSTATSNMYSECIVHELSGVNTNTPLDNNQHKISAQNGPGTGTDAITSGSVTTTQNGDYIFGWTVNDGANSATLAAGTGYMARVSIGGGVTALSEEMVQPAAGTIAATFTGSPGFGNYTTGIIAFQPAATSWSGIISPSRAIDWSQAGTPSTIMNESRSPCSTSACTILNTPANVTAANINAAISSALPHTVVLLPAGTFNLSSGILFNNVSNVTLRGAGPDQTFLKFTGGSNCGGWGGDICIINADPDCGGCGSPSNASNWTGPDPYTPGTSVITLSGLVTGSTPPAAGQLIFLDQLDDSTTDTGQVWICQTANTCAQQNGSQNGRPGRGQQQAVMAKNVSGSGPYTVTISPAIYMPNWSTSKTPQAWWSNSLPISGVGIENLSIDNSGTVVTGSMMAGIMIANGYGNWVKNVRDINSPHEHVQFYQSAHNTVQSSYFYGSFNAASQSYGVDNYNGADNLVENNIFQHIAQSMMTEGCVGCVFAYNYSLDDWYTNGDPNWQEPSSWGHSVGDAYILWEGNEGIGLIGDDIHGTRHFVTAFRNYWTGLDAASGGSTIKSEQTTPLILEGYNRYFNVIGNVLGTTSRHTNYQVSPPCSTDPVNCATDPGDATTSNRSIYSLGYSGNQSTYGGFKNDTFLANSLMRWGNYDVANNAVRFVSAEVPSTLTCSPTPCNSYANAVPSNNNVPESFYLSAKPSWFGSITWPPIGPPVTAGSGYSKSDIPAKICYANARMDPSYQQTYTVQTASWAANNPPTNPSTATLTFTPSNPAWASGGAQSFYITITGVNPSAYNVTNAAILNSTSTSITFELDSNPGGYVSGGQFIYPNILLFNADSCYAH